MTNNSKRIRVGDRVTIYPRGKKKIWCADFWFDGQHHRESLETGNKKVALRRAVKLDGDLVSGKYQSQRPAEAVTVRQAVEDYLAYLATEGRARKTLVRYRGELSALRDFLEGHKATRLAQVTPLQFDKFRAERRKDHCPRTLYHEGVVAKQFLDWCRTCKLLVVSPLVDYRLRKPELEPKGGPTLVQVDRILAASQGPRTTQFAVLAFAGIRAGQLRLLRPADVDLKGGWITIQPVEGAKTKRKVTVPIHARLKALLEKIRATSKPWFFTEKPSRKYPAGNHWINTKRLNEDFEKLVRKLGVPAGQKDGGFTVHSLRRFFRTFTTNAGVPREVVDAWMGHRSDRSMASVYYKLSDDVSQQFMEKVPFGTGELAASASKE
jgi:integrase